MPGAGGRFNLSRQLPTLVDEQAELFRTRGGSVPGTDPSPISFGQMPPCCKTFAHPPPFAFVPVAHLSFGNVKSKAGGIGAPAARPRLTFLTSLLLSLPSLPPYICEALNSRGPRAVLAAARN